MIWMFICFIGYFFFYWFSKVESIGRTRVFYVNCMVLFLNGILYVWSLSSLYFSCFSLGALLFLFQGIGLFYLLETKIKRHYLQYLPLLILTLLYISQFLMNWYMIEGSLLNKIVMVTVFMTSFLYGCYGYWYLMKNFLDHTVRQYISFYVVILFCIAMAFLIVYFYNLPLFSYLDFFFQFISFCLLFGAFFNEVKNFAYLRLNKYRYSLRDQFEHKSNRLFEEVVLEVTLPENERLSLWSKQQVKRTELPLIDKELPLNKVKTSIKFDEIRQVLTDKLIENQLFLDPTLNLEQLALILQLPKIELIDYFKASSSMTFKHYINRLKVEYAVVLIKDGEENYTVEELSLLCGFNTRLSFYRAFVEVFGFAPSEIIS